MVALRMNERRRATPSTLRLGRPLFIQVPRSAAASVLVACALTLVIAAQLSPPSIKLGSALLLVCALGAWFVGNRFAILLGIFLVAINFMNGQLIDIRGAHIDQLVDVTIRLACAVAIVLMLGVARLALEIEWRQARIDPLTGALNRKAFFEAVQTDTPCDGLTVLIFADLDGLKRLNDKLGHEEGDAAIRHFAQSVKKSIRKQDLFARIGGDEFLIHMKVPDVAAAQAVVARLHETINLQSIHETELKCSLGILLMPSGTRSIDCELRLADSLMYEAKRMRSGFSIAMMTEDNPGNLVRIDSDLNVTDRSPSEQLEQLAA